ncbi:MAG: DUF378 domain-containing protein [Patescibacteria group bacterium]|nr:DUF378 domain-containing protein [Patescibacteria group bacterium]MDE2438490.1 DUF378 domain-containing protein [Patescibacteria group bacterium]
MMSLHKIAYVLLLIGGLNWLLVGGFHWSLGLLFGGDMAMASRVIYVLVGLSALYELFSHKGRCKECAM